MTSLSRMDAALRFWQSRYDVLAIEMGDLLTRHATLQGVRDDHRTKSTEGHQRVVGAETSAGDALLTLHMHLVAHSRYDQRTATQQQALSEQIEEKRGQMVTLKRKLKQVEIIKTGAERSRADAMQRRLDEEASYLFLIRNRAE